MNSEVKIRLVFFFSSRRRHTRSKRDWSSDVCSSDLDPAVWLRDYESLPEDELTAMARNREATALFAWNPYMYDPKLKARLHRIRIPTLFLWGAQDGFAPLSYGRSFCAAVPGAKFEEIDESGHFPYMEQPETVARRVIEFGLERQAPLAWEKETS